MLARGIPHQPNRSLAHIREKLFVVLLVMAPSPQELEPPANPGWLNFLAEALAKGAFRPAPPARIIGHGLESLQTALDIQKRGVPGTKVVVSLRA